MSTKGRGVATYKLKETNSILVSVPKKVQMRFILLRLDLSDKPNSTFEKNAFRLRSYDDNRLIS